MNFVFFVLEIAVLVFGLHTASSANEIRGRIFNGHAAREGEFKFMALLVSEEVRGCGLIRRAHTCGGAIIGQNWVLTAAHCVAGTLSTEVHLGSTKASEVTIAYVVSHNNFVFPPNWDKKFTINDIALIRIPTTTECDNIVYARLPLQSADLPPRTFAKKTAIIMGWGFKGNKGEISDRLYKAKVKVMSNRKCQHDVPFITDADLCVMTNKPFGSICHGDSGGPLVLEDSGELIAVASFFLKEGCEDGFPAIFMRVTSHLQWIIEVMGRKLHERY